MATSSEGVAVNSVIRIGEERMRYPVLEPVIGTGCQNPYFHPDSSFIRAPLLPYTPIHQRD